MENAAKALQIAGGVLLSIMILGIIVFAYNNWKKLGQSEYQSDIEEQAVDFNKQFDMYMKNGVYGTEILSLANKINNYNAENSDTDKHFSSSESQKGYTKIDLRIKKNNPILTSFSSDYNKNDMKNAERLDEDYRTLLKNISNYSTLDENKIDGRTIAQWYRASYELIQSSPDKSAIQSKVNEYKRLLEDQTDFARKQFDCTKVIYDNKTGRITELWFDEK